MIKSRHQYKTNKLPEVPAPMSSRHHQAAHPLDITKSAQGKNSLPSLATFGISPSKMDFKEEEARVVLAKSPSVINDRDQQSFYNAQGFIHEPQDLTRQHEVATLPDGSQYEGFLRFGRREGLGKCIFRNGDKYDGEWKNDQMHGKGTFIWTSNERYDGQWKEGKRHGKGRHFSNGSCYDGDWVDGVKHGWGKLTWKSGKIYEGDWNEGSRSGKGSFIWPNGDRYDGQWLSGKKHGFGILLWQNGNKYEGDWANDRRNGHGVFSWLNGDVFDGAWLDGKKGQGEYKIKANPAGDAGTGTSEEKSLYS